MRWQKQPWPKEGDRRIKTRFLVLPKTINREVRWLEKATWEEEYHLGYDFHQFVPVRWVDNG